MHQSGVSWCTMPRKRSTRRKVKRSAKAGMVRVSVGFQGPDYAELEIVARDKRVSIAWVVRDAVSGYLTARSPLFRASPNPEESA